MKNRTIIGALPAIALSALAGCSGTETTGPDGSTKSCVGEIAWYASNSTGTALEVGKKSPNKFGLYDMLGNAVEWVADCYHETYSGAPTNGSAWDEGSCKYRVVRGGCYGSTERGVRVSVREGVTTGFYGACAPGVRCARSPGSSSPKDGGASADKGTARADAGKTVSLSWVQVPGGSFQMGCSTADTQCETSESPVHTVTVASFEMTKYEVTQQEYFDKTGDSPFTYHCPACAATYVGWENAKAFCEALGGRLLTEAEWEYAARAGTTTRFPCGN